MRTPHFSESDEAALQARLEDWIDQCRTRRKPVRSCFLSPSQQEALKPFLPWDLAYRWDGGCAEAERKKADPGSGGRRVRQRHRLFDRADFG